MNMADLRSSSGSFLERGGSFRQSLSDRFRTGQIRKSIMVE